MDVKAIMEILAAAPELGKIWERVSKIHGFIHKKTEAAINGIRGFLVWDFVVYNEITFDDAEGNIMPFFTSISDDKTEAEWNRLVKKYGVNTD